MEKILDFKIKGRDFINAGESTSKMKNYFKKIGISSKIIKRILVASYEAELNVVAHADSGVMEIFVDEDKIVVTVEDEGPGIEDIDRAMQEGFSTASDEVREMGFGAGMGLPNIKRNSDDLEIESEVNKGTRVKMVFNVS
ncbi:MAG: anti-sigma regulatory factor [Candidatus Mcinerneyibacterium aminivorans]|uniref:Anti-sigma regulatory factor n=1 Tax=Candidatus Mcinerneyibacterium aminivorans TaxID=2703815 RepID=A0A5D0MK41_9BACT|nr:MAG: anti-sigma regulatory factor [Candidatus Mcinerneyibacterium aminivorans]